MKSKYLQSFCILAGCLLALLFIVLIISPENVNPLNTNWVTKGGGDNFQHYLGWRYYRNSSWNRYLFFMRNLNYPIGTSVIVTDSNPLFCLFFKIFRNVIPAQFQFNGIWLVISYVLIAFFSSKIGWRLTKDVLLTIVCVLFSVLNPVILQRAIIHDTLTAHWLILAAFYLLLNWNSKWNLPGWILLIELALLIHVYFIPMLCFVFVLQIIQMMIKKAKAVRILCIISAFILALLAGYFVIGYVNISPQSGSYGELSMNLNAFINPDSIPAMLKARPIQSLQYEGFNYYGLGMLILILLFLIFGKKRKFRLVLPYILPVIGLVFISISNTVYFDDKLIFKLSLPENLYSALSVFRSSGRLVWPLYYMVLFGIIYIMVDNESDADDHERKAAMAQNALDDVHQLVIGNKIVRSDKSQKMMFKIIMLFCSIIQIIDLHQFHQETAYQFRNPENTLVELPVEFTKLIPDDAAHFYCSAGDSKTIDALALFAIDNKMTFNRSANARGIRHIYGGDELEMENMNCDDIRFDSVYVYLTEALLPSVLKSCKNVSVAELSDWLIVTRIK